MKLLRDFGVSALALTGVLAIMGAGGIILVLKGQQEFALAWVGSLATLAKAFYDGYLQKRKEEQNRQHRDPGEPPG